MKGVLTRISFALGSLGLLLAMTFDVVAVIGRGLGVPLLGSIELIQACVVLAASASLVSATLGGSHATMHVLVERLRPRLRRALSQSAQWLSALFFLWLSAGSIWVAAELWPGREATELLRLAIAPLRALFCASTLLAALLFVVSALRVRRGSP
jgi:TRAP-type C4-dicarboxylate transport system permease small subunit